MTETSVPENTQLMAAKLSEPQIDTKGSGLFSGMGKLSEKSSS